jgi:hypothetical protein
MYSKNPKYVFIVGILYCKFSYAILQLPTLVIICVVRFLFVLFYIVCV